MLKLRGEGKKKKKKRKETKIKAEEHPGGTASPEAPRQQSEAEAQSPKDAKEILVHSLPGPCSSLECLLPSSVYHGETESSPAITRALHGSDTPPDRLFLCSDHKVRKSIF